MRCVRGKDSRDSLAVISRPRLHGETPASFSTSSVDDGSTAFGLHAFAEPVGPLAFNIRWLKRPFHFWPPRQTALRRCLGLLDFRRRCSRRRQQWFSSTIRTQADGLHAPSSNKRPLYGLAERIAAYYTRPAKTVSTKSPGRAWQKHSSRNTIHNARRPYNSRTGRHAMANPTETPRLF